MRIRRAKWALRALIALYTISLGSELICNSRPLLMRYEGNWFAPFIKNPDLRSVTEGTNTTALINYRSFTRTANFTNNTANFVLWAPVRYTPNDTIDSATLAEFITVTAHIVPEVFVCRFDLLPDQRIVRCENCARFFPGGYDFDHDRLSDHWRIPDEVLKAAQQRYGERAAPRVEVNVQHLRDKNLRATLTMPAFEPNPYGATPTARISLRMEGRSESPLAMRFRKSGDGVFKALEHRRWQEVPTALQTEILALVAKSFAGEKAQSAIQWKNRAAQVKCVLNEISWPHPPVAGHCMGIDSAGCDVFAHVLYALRISMTFGIILSLWAMLLGIVFGAIQGYFGGKVDICGQRLTEIWSAMPFLYIMILIGAVLGRSFMLLLIVYGLFNWLGMSYYMRAEFLRLRSYQFVEAARCQGLSSLRIIMSHILPNAVTPIITLLPFTLAGAIGALAALDFLGFGLPPLTPSWGQLLQQAQHFRSAWWLIFFPSLALVTVILLTVIIGEGLRDAFDPKQQSRME